VAPDVSPGSVVTTNVPPRLDRLRWSGWHSRVILALGITWTLDGLEASLIASIGPTLRNPRTLGLTALEVGGTNSAYLLGEVAGALLFGHLTDRFGRRRLFFITLTLYLFATALSGLSPDFALFLICRFFAGSGIGGEYSAINSAIDELVPAGVRGQVDLAINGSYWLGVAMGGALTLLLLNPAILPVWLGWRFSFGLGALLGVLILILRRHVPESPRWLLMHGYVREADKTTHAIEHEADQSDAPTPPPVSVRVTGVVGLGHLFRTLFVRFPKRTILGLALMVAQTFFYNSIFFTNGLILERFHHVRADRVGLFLIPFALGNFVGPLLLGRLFDRWGRRVMIPATFSLAGLLLVGTGGLFLAGWLTAFTQTVAWCVVFFFASSAASSAYLTVSELFPVELRGLAIALFYALATGVGSVAPSLFGHIVDTGSLTLLFAGYVGAATLMLAAAVIARLLGVRSEGRSLEELAAQP
jgi:MFS family permease